MAEDISAVRVTWRSESSFSVSKLASKTLATPGYLSSSLMAWAQRKTLARYYELPFILATWLIQNLTLPNLFRDFVLLV